MSMAEWGLPHSIALHSKTITLMEIDTVVDMVGN